jgi:hypothetical protein
MMCRLGAPIKTRQLVPWRMWRKIFRLTHSTPTCDISNFCARRLKIPKRTFNNLTMGKQFAARLHLLPLHALDHLQLIVTSAQCECGVTLLPRARVHLIIKHVHTCSAEIGIMLFPAILRCFLRNVRRWRTLICIILIVISLLFAMAASC